MQNQGDQRHARPTPPWVVAALYVVFAGAWIIGSDRLLSAVSPDGLTRQHLEVAKGLVFVSLTGGLLWLLLCWDWKRARRIEADLRESEERLRRAITDSPIPIMLHAEDGAVVQVSGSWCQISGYAPEELRTIADWIDRAYGDHRHEVQSKIGDLYKLEAPVAEGDFPVRTKSGETRIWEFSSGPAGRLPDGRRLVITTAVDVTERRVAERQVRQLNAELEDRVRQRTDALQFANRELESFSYSVSHDLRAPLRAINGFARILVEDHGGNLTAEGQRVAGVVRTEAQRMGRLIDDLLAFSRLGRAAMRPVPVDMTALAQSVFNELCAAQPERKVDFRLHPLPAAHGDLNLLRQVWANLIGNALKYTAKTAEPRIEIGGAEVERESVYFIRDNGAGFDSQYADKLFRVFQRLHRESEFEGTGIGLALVQRIVGRHSGRVWAEGEIGKGACFHFALPSRRGEEPLAGAGPA